MAARFAAAALALALGGAGAYVFVTENAGIGSLLIGLAMFVGLAGAMRDN